MSVCRHSIGHQQKENDGVVTRNDHGQVIVLDGLQMKMMTKVVEHHCLQEEEEVDSHRPFC
jgi:hypothetical protein